MANTAMVRKRSTICGQIRAQSKRELAAAAIVIVIAAAAVLMITYIGLVAGATG
jgi:hypothetical protein